MVKGGALVVGRASAHASTVLKRARPPARPPDRPTLGDDAPLGPAPSRLPAGGSTGIVVEFGSRTPAGDGLTPLRCASPEGPDGGHAGMPVLGSGLGARALRLPAGAGGGASNWGIACSRIGGVAAAQQAGGPHRQHHRNSAMQPRSDSMAARQIPGCVDTRLSTVTRRFGSGVHMCVMRVWPSASVSRPATHQRSCCSARASAAKATGCL